MASKTMPGTPKQHSVARPAQGVAPIAIKTRTLSKGPKLAVPSYKRAVKRTGSLVVS